MLLADQDAVGVEGLVSSFGWTNNEVIDLICIYLIHGLWILVFLFLGFFFSLLWIVLLLFLFICPSFHLASRALSPLSSFFYYSFSLSFSVCLSVCLSLSLFPPLSLSLFPPPLSLSPSLPLSLSPSLSLSSKCNNMMCKSLIGFYLTPLSLL